MSPIKVAALQYPISFLSSFKDWQKKIEEWVAQAATEKVEFVLFPEYGAMELTSLLSQSDRKNLKQQSRLLRPFLDDFLETFKNLAQKYSCYIIAPSFPFFQSEILTTNRVYIFSAAGEVEHQDKFFMTRFEDEEWGVQSGEKNIKIFRTQHISFSILTCFDIEFALPASLAAQNGASVVFVPSCTETIRGAHRVHIGAKARALENQIYTVVSQTVGIADWSPAVDLNTGFAAVYATPDAGFSEDGVVQIGTLNTEKTLICKLDMSLIENVRRNGAVLNYKHHGQLLSQMSTPFKTQLIDF